MPRWAVRSFGLNSSGASKYCALLPSEAGAVSAGGCVLPAGGAGVTGGSLPFICLSRDSGTDWPGSIVGCDVPFGVAAGCGPAIPPVLVDSTIFALPPHAAHPPGASYEVCDTL